MRVLVSGAKGYKGSVLVPMLQQAGHDVTLLDIGWFVDNAGVPLSEDVRLVTEIDQDFDVVIHLAGIALDAAGQVNPGLAWEVNALGTMRLAEAAKRAGVRQFIFASSGSVYGRSDAPNVTEDHPLLPMSDYNKTKMLAERVLMSYADDFVVQIVRPGSVCGFSPRMRLDLLVNTLTFAALTKRKITVFGGQQYRPAVHIQDICRVYEHMLLNPTLTGIYNAAVTNLSVEQTALLVQSLMPHQVDIVIQSSDDDQRSYRLDSSKLLATGFEFRHSIADAIREMVVAFADGLLVDNPRWHSLAWMKHIGVIV